MAATKVNPLPVSATNPVNPLEFVPPPVEIGQVVLWSYGDADKPTPALVLGVATRSLTLAVHVAGVKDHVGRYGVRHVRDPLVRARAPSDQGVWDLTDRDKRLNALLDSFGTGAEE